MQIRLVIMFLLGAFSIYAQTVLGTFSLKNKPTENAYKVSRQGKPVKIFFQNDAEYELLCLDSSLSNPKNFGYSGVEKKNRFVGSLESDSQLSLYFVNPKTGKFSVLTHHSSDSSFSSSELHPGSATEDFLKCVVVKNRINALSVKKDSNILVIRSFVHTKQISTDSFKIDFPDFNTSLKSDLNMLNQESYSELGITSVDYEVPQDISDIYTDRKLSVRDDKIVMVFDQRSTSHLVIIDLTKKKSYYKKFSFKLELETSDNTMTGNSFLFKDYFFRVTSDGHQINLAIVDFRTFKLIRNHNIYDGQAIAIKNGPLLLEESTNGSVPRISPIKNSERFFRLVRGSDLGVTANIAPNNTFELMIGSHSTEIFTAPVMGSGLSVGGFGTGGLGLGVGIGIGTGVGVGGSMVDPNHFPYGMSAARGYSVNIEKAYFHSILTEKEFAHVPIPLKNNYLDRRNTFWEQNFKAGRIPEIYVEYQQGDKMHYGYWEKKTNRFTVLAFEK